MIKKVFKFLNDVIGMPYYIFINTIKGIILGLKKSFTFSKNRGII